jgi:hypothetical protein
MNITRRTAIIIEILGGALGGALIGVPFALVGGQLGALQENGFGDLVGVLLGALLGYPLGVTAGVSFAGRRLQQQGSPWRTLLGSFVGGGLALLLAALLGLNQSPAVLQGLFVVLPPLLATLAFNWRRGGLGPVSFE